mmetsp:Transcript_41182/g.98892  ORF Transcript_41182/g.98892 Transcript_41182/m.98892 type:complete len:200 (-) Transcript_41182:156-755(-)
MTRQNKAVTMSMTASVIPVTIILRRMMLPPPEQSMPVMSTFSLGPATATPNARPTTSVAKEVMLSNAICVSLGANLGWVMFMTQMGGVVVEVSLKVAATKSSVTRQLKKICDTCSSRRWRSSSSSTSLGLVSETRECRSRVSTSAVSSAAAAALMLWYSKCLRRENQFASRKSCAASESLIRSASLRFSSTLVAAFEMS